jgi:hypothetical protein
MDKKWLRKKHGVKQAGNFFNNRPIDSLQLDSKLASLIAKMQEGDELWSFRSDPESWENRAGRSGTSVVRNGEVIHSIIDMMS